MAEKPKRRAEPAFIEPKLFEIEVTKDLEPQLPQLPYPIWTENKVKLIAKYIFLFELITKHGTYIDGFAGPQRPDQPEMWAAKLVLEIEPQWLRHFYLFEKSKAGCDLLSFLKASQAATKDPEIEVFCGDFNVKVDSILSSRRIGEKEATFCLLDQRTFECHWSTVKKLAGYKTGKSNKFELFYFLAGWWYRRAVTAVKRDSVLENWWGRNDWPDLRQKKVLAVQDEMVARFKSELGYTSAKAWPILDRAGRDMYFMIHATDYLGAPALMQRAWPFSLPKGRYNKASSPAGRNPDRRGGPGLISAKAFVPQAAIKESHILPDSLPKKSLVVPECSYWPRHLQRFVRAFYR